MEPRLGLIVVAVRKFHVLTDRVTPLSLQDFLSEILFSYTYLTVLKVIKNKKKALELA